MTTIELSSPRAGVAVITLDRPDRLNAMNHELVQDLHDAFDGLRFDRSTRVVVLTGAGRGFCAGLDLKGAGRAPGTAGLGPVPAGMVSQQHIASLVPKMRSLRQPIIAAVNGPAAGGGWRWRWPATCAWPRPRLGSTSPSCASACPAATSG